MAFFGFRIDGRRKRWAFGWVWNWERDLREWSRARE